MLLSRIVLYIREGEVIVKRVRRPNKMRIVVGLYDITEGRILVWFLGGTQGTGKVDDGE